MAGNNTVYLKCDRNVEVQAPDVYLHQLGEVYCMEKIIQAKCRALKIYHFSEKDKKRCVLSVMKIVKLMEAECPGISVEVLGETDVLVEWINVNRHKGAGQWAKAVGVSLISFFGTAFTIMAYHNDIGVNDLFEKLYRMVMGREAAGVNVLEVSYSIGLAAGIIIFFNHIGGRRITKDPTPLEVAMRNYEKDVDMALIETAGREGKEMKSN